MAGVEALISPENEYVPSTSHLHTVALGNEGETGASLSLNVLNNLAVINTFKYHVSCTDGKISVKINLLFYLYFPPSSLPTFLCFFPGKNGQMLDGRTVENKGKTIN